MTAMTIVMLASRDLADPAVIDTVRRIEKLGQDQYSTCVKKRPVNQTKSIADPITRNNLSLFGPTVQTKSRGKLLVSLKSDCSLFSRRCNIITDGDLNSLNMKIKLAHHPW